MLKTPWEELSAWWWNPILSGIAGCSSRRMNISVSVAKQEPNSSDGLGAVSEWIVSTLVAFLGVEVKDEAQDNHQPHSFCPGLRQGVLWGGLAPSVKAFDAIYFWNSEYFHGRSKCESFDKAQWLLSQLCYGGDRPTLVPAGWVQAREEC